MADTAPPAEATAMEVEETTAAAPAADSTPMDTAEGEAAAASSSSAAAGADSSEARPEKEKKEKKRKKEKKHKKEKKREKKAREAAGEDGEEGDAAAGGGEEDESESAPSEPSEDLEDEEAEVKDADEEKRRRARRARKEAKSKKGADKVAKKKRRDASKFLDMEAEVSSDEEVSADEDDPEEADGFIKDLVVPDDEIEADLGPRRNRRKGKRIREAELDEEDYNLLSENLGMTVHRTDIDKDLKDSDDEDVQRQPKRSRLHKGTGESAINYEELDRRKRERERMERHRRARGDLPDEDGLDAEEDDFLAPEDDGSMGGKRAAKHKVEDGLDNFVEDDTKVSSSHANAAGGEFSSKQKERLRELFGSVTSFFQTKRGTKKGGDDSDGAYGEDGEEPAPEDGDSSADSEGEREIERKRKARLAPQSGKTLRVREREQRALELRMADIPERLQARHKKRQAIIEGTGLADAEADSKEREAEALWIFEQIFRGPMAAVTTGPYGEQGHARLERPLVPTIVAMLQYMQEEHLEIHFIATYRREFWCGQMMQPDARLSEEELLRIDELDERWIEMGMRRRRLVKLLNNYNDVEHVRQLHEADSIGGSARGWSDHATPTAAAVLEWRNLLGEREITGNVELDDLQDVLTALAAIEACKRRQAVQTRRDQREYARRQRHEQRATLAREKAEAAARKAEEREKRRAELANSFEAGMAAGAEMDEEEDLVKVEADAELDQKSEPEPEEEDVDMEDAANSIFSQKKGRSQHKLQALAKAWAISGTPQLAAALGMPASELAENLNLNFAKNTPRDSAWNVDYLAEEAIRFQKVKSVDEALACARRYAAFLLATDPLVRRHVRKEFMAQAEIYTMPTAKGIREIDDSHEYFTVKRLMGKPITRMSQHPAQFLLIHQAEQEGFIRVDFRLPRNPDTVNRVASLAMEDAEADSITANLCSLYLSSGTSADARLWNAERRLVIHDAMSTFLLPLCHTHARTVMLKHAMEFVSGQITKKLMQTLSMAGFQPPVTETRHAADEDDDSSSSKKKKKKQPSATDTNWRIFAILVGDEWTPSYVAVLNRYGGVVDHLVLHFLKNNAQARSRTGEAQSEGERAQYGKKKADTQALLQLVATHQPKLIVVDATNMDTRLFKDELVTKTLLDYPNIRVDFMDPEVSRIFMNSARAELEFKDYPRNLRQAICMGRQALDPISEFAGLYSGPMDAGQWSDSANTSAQLMHSIQSSRNEDDALKKDIVAASSNALQNDMLALSLHPLQRKLPVRMLMATMQRVLVRLVNYVGVDINKIIQRPWLTGSLQFVNGLGPVKAKYLMDYAKKQGYIASRDELLNKVLAQAAEERATNAMVKGEDGSRTAAAAASVAAATVAAAAAAKADPGLFGPCIYRNCAGFLIIRRNAAMDSLDEIDSHPLDETRVHPEHYDHANHVVMNSLEIPPVTPPEGTVPMPTKNSFEHDVAKQIAKDKKRQRKEDQDDADLLDEDGEVDEAKRSARDEERGQQAHQAASTKVLIRYIRMAMEPEHAEELTALDLDAFDRTLCSDGSPSVLETLQQIVLELPNPFSDVRSMFVRFASPSPHRLFYLLTGETSRTLREGMLMPVVINGIHPGGKGAYVRLDSGIRGFLAFRNVSDSAPQGARRDQFSDPREAALEVESNLAWIKSRLTPGLSVDARIIRIEKDKFSVELSTKSSDLNQQLWVQNTEQRVAKQQEMAAKWGRPNLDEVDEIEQSLYFNDPYLFVGQHTDDAAVLAIEAGPQRAEKRFRQRNITHTLFRNVSREDSIIALKDKAIGEVVVRPSSLGTNHLTLTWKVSDQEVSAADPAAADSSHGIYFHVDIKEEQKPNELEIGTKLIVRADKYEFEDLDEIVARFVNPMVKWVNELTAHKNFRFGNEAEIHGILFAEKQQDRNKFPYALHFATRKEKAGAFQFSFLPNAEVKSSSFVVVPEGYLYHERSYSSVNALLSAIKAEMSKKVGVAPPAGSLQAAKAGSSRVSKDRKPAREASLPPYAGAPQAGSRPPYAGPPAGGMRPPPQNMPPYAGASGGSMPPYAGAGGPPSRPPYGAPPPQNMPPYAGASQGGYGAPLPQPPRPQYQQPYQQQPPQQQQQQYHTPQQYAPPQQQYGAPPQQQYGGSYPPQQQQQQQQHYQPQQHQQQHLPPPPQPMAAAPAPAAGGATSGFVHPSRMGIVAHPTGPQQSPPPPQQPPQAARSRWGTAANSRNDDMQM